MIVLTRGKKDIAAQVLEAVIERPDTAPTRIFGKVGVSYRFLETMRARGVMAISLVSSSRIILGAHYLTDVAGGIFLSLAAQRLASLSLPLLKRKIAKRWLGGRHRQLTTDENANLCRSIIDPRV